MAERALRWVKPAPTLRVTETLATLSPHSSLFHAPVAGGWRRPQRGRCLKAFRRRPATSSWPVSLSAPIPLYLFSVRSITTPGVGKPLSRCRRRCEEKPPSLFAPEGKTSSRQWRRGGAHPLPMFFVQCLGLPMRTGSRGTARHKGGALCR
jgi:hypothetical protein